MQALLIAGFVTFAAAALPDTAKLKSIFIDGQGPKKSGTLTQAQIDSIDRELTIEFDYPAFTMSSAMPSPFNDTCGLGTVSCPAHKFSLTPGMDVSMIDVRGFAMTTASEYLTKISPTITFDMNAGKKYSFLMFDTLSEAPFWSAGMMASLQALEHYSVVNMDQSSGLSADLKTTFRPSGNVVAANPSIYAFTVWEHTQDATKPEPIGPMGSQFTVQKWIQAAGIANASLVAMNYYKGYGNVYSRATMKNNPALASNAPSCTAGGFSSANKMCMSGTPVEATSGGSTTSWKRSLIFGIALAVTVTRH